MIKKLNFKEFSIYTDVGKRKKIVADVREAFANVVYVKATGVRAHSVALRIYESDGAAEYAAADVDLIISMANEYCTPAFMDGLQLQLNTKEYDNNR